MSGIKVRPSRGRLLTPSEVAALFRVDPKTVTRWAKAGRLDSVRTPGGHHRFWEEQILAMVEAGQIPTDEQDGEQTVPTQRMAA